MSNMCVSRYVPVKLYWCSQTLLYRTSILFYFSEIGSIWGTTTSCIDVESYYSSQIAACWTGSLFPKRPDLFLLLNAFLSFKRCRTALCRIHRHFKVLNEMIHIFRRPIPVHESIFHPQLWTVFTIFIFFLVHF